MNRYSFCAFFALFTCALSAQTKYSNEFLTIGVGGRSLAMGQATVALSSDVTSGYWNPAGLASLANRYDASLMHSEYFAGIAKYDYGAFAYKYDERSAVGFTVLRYAVDNIPNTLELFDSNGNMRYDLIKSFSAADYAFLLSYARQSAIEGLNLGGSVKIIRRITGSFAGAWGFGIDAGIRYSRNQWTYAAVVRDATSTFNAWTFNNTELKEVFETTGNDIPTNSVEVTLPRLITGISRNIKLSDKFGALTEADIEFTFDGKRNTLVSSKFANIDPKIGIEFNYNKLVYLRAGVNNIQKTTDFDGSKQLNFQPNMGLGLEFKNINIDYAFANIGEAVGRSSHVFSLRFRFGSL